MNQKIFPKHNTFDGLCAILSKLASLQICLTRKGGEKMCCLSKGGVNVIKVRDKDKIKVLHNLCYRKRTRGADEGF